MNSGSRKTAYRRDAGAEKLHKIYRALDFLEANRCAIAEAIFHRVLEQHYPTWREARAELNELPLAAEAWAAR